MKSFRLSIFMPSWIAAAKMSRSISAATEARLWRQCTGARNALRREATDAGNSAASL